jgi:hypothetical protein
MTIPKASDYFHKFFPEKPINEFLDPLLSYINKSPKIDIGKFDDYIHSKHGDYEKKKLSMGDVLEKHYGKEAKDFIESLI